MKTKKKKEQFSRKIDGYFSLVMIHEFDKDANLFPVSINNTKDILKKPLCSAELLLSMVIYQFYSWMEGNTYYCGYSSANLLMKPKLLINYERFTTRSMQEWKRRCEINRNPFFSIPENVEPIARPGNMSINDFKRSLIIQVKMFSALTESLEPALRSYLIAQPRTPIIPLWIRNLIWRI
jgi:hypothetical protein